MKALAAPTSEMLFHWNLPGKDLETGVAPESELKNRKAVSVLTGICCYRFRGFVTSQCLVAGRLHTPSDERRFRLSKRVESIVNRKQLNEPVHVAIHVRRMVKSSRYIGPFRPRDFNGGDNNY